MAYLEPYKTKLRHASDIAAFGIIFQTLKPGGCLLIRDYGLYDYAMLRFAPGHKLSENFYVRQDGTRAYYFSLGNKGL